VQLLEAVFSLRPAPKMYTAELGRIHRSCTTPRIVTKGLGTKNDCAGEAQQQFIRHADRNIIPYASFYSFKDNKSKVIIEKLGVVSDITDR
jgi:hypothetical protein